MNRGTLQMPAIVDQVRTRVRSVMARTGVGGLQGPGIINNVKAAGDLIRREGLIGVGQRAARGEKPIMSRLMPQMARPPAPAPAPAPPAAGSLQRAPSGEAAPERKKKEQPISIVA